MTPVNTSPPRILPALRTALLIDAGNTRIKWAIAAIQACASQPDIPVEAGCWLETGVVEKPTMQTLSAAWRQATLTHQPAQVLISNVAGAAIADQLQALLQQAGLAACPIAWFRSEAEAGGLRNRYRDPAQLGCDRFASAIGARRRFPGEPLLVVTSGTATTIDAITADGVFSGGMILPGLATMAASLARNTAQLPQTPQIDAIPFVDQPFADHTAAGIVSGCVHAHVGAILHAQQLWTTANGHDVAPRCILSGGAASLIALYLPAPFEQIDHLVLLGLHTFLLSPSC